MERWTAAQRKDFLEYMVDHCTRYVPGVLLLPPQKNVVLFAVLYVVVMTSLNCGTLFLTFAITPHAAAADNDAAADTDAADTDDADREEVFTLRNAVDRILPEETDPLRLFTRPTCTYECSTVLLCSATTSARMHARTKTRARTRTLILCGTLSSFQYGT